MYVVPTSFSHLIKLTKRRRALEGWCLSRSLAVHKAYPRHSRLILGGGFGWLSGQYGLTIDNLVQVHSCY
jgi:hypothetical protein